jgi:PST family polysaccharide transporter
VTAALSVTFLLGALAVQYNIELNLAGQWRRLAFVQAAPGLIALPTAAVLAAVTGSYWAVVAQTLVTSLLGLFLAVWLSDWTPGWPRLRVKMRRHLVFGRDTMVVQALNYAAANGDNVLIGRFLGSSVLGQYNRAYNLALLPLSQISIPLEQIILPRLSAALDDGFEEVMLRCQRIMVYVQLIPISLLAGTAGPLVRVFLGPHWSEVPSLIQIQAIGAGASALGYMFWWVLLVRRQTRIIVLTEGTVEIVMLVAMALVVHTGASAVAWCVALGQVLMVFTSAIACRRLASIDIARLARASGSALAITGAAGLSAGLIASAHWSGPFVLLMASGAAWLMTFVVGWILFKRIRDDVRMMAGLLRRSVRHDSLPSSAHNAPVADGAIT